MNVTIVKADPSRLAECREVFLDSALYDHYFTAEGRLEGMLATAVEKGELWLAVTSRNEVAGVMWMEMTGFFDVFPYLALLGVKKSFRGMGVGHVLLQALIERCERGPWRQMVAVIGNSGNAGSIALHAVHGFRHTGVLQSAGYKLGQWVDVVLMQRALGLGDTTKAL